MARSRLALTAAAIASAVGGRLQSGSPERAIDGFSIDSRTLARGDLFFAIVAARDGHEFVRDALDRGAAGAVVQAPKLAEALRAKADARAVVIEVDDTTRALQALGRHVRRASGATVIAITGSAGKTTTKETIAEFLAARYDVVRNPGNLNNHLGLPLSLLELRHGADVAVMELGMSHTGEIRVLVGLAEPEVRVWTNIGDAHLGHFPSQDAIADAKAEILENASKTDLLVYNADDRHVTARVPKFAGRTISFGTSDRADIRAETIENLGVHGMRARVRTPAGTTDLTIPLLGRGNLANVLAAIGVAIDLGVPLAEVTRRASLLSPAHHRGAVVRLAKGVTVIDDSYNSSPSALEKVLEVVARERGATRKAAVLGEMLELGEHTTRLHEVCGALAAASGLSRLIAVGGPPAQELAAAAVAAGMNRAAVSWADTSQAAADQIASWLRAGDLLLVKGSRGIKTDAVVDRITAEFA